YQGVGIGMALSSFCAGLWKALGHRACSTTTHPAFIAARLRSSDWRLVRRPSLAGTGSETRRSVLRHASTRLTAGFEYVGLALEAGLARRLVCVVYLLALSASEGWSHTALRLRSGLVVESHMNLTIEIERLIVAAIRAGGYAHVAAEAAGVP